MGPKTKQAKATAHAPEEPAAVWVEIGQLTPWAKNPRKNESAIPKVVESIKRFGFAAPIVARKADGEIIAGHTRYAAAQALGMTKVPVRYVDLDPSEAHLLALADNKLSEKADWDEQILTSVMGEYDFSSLELAGWSQVDIDKMGTSLLEKSESTPLYEAKFQVLVRVKDEDEQAKLYERLTEEGFECELLML